MKLLSSLLLVGAVLSVAQLGRADEVDADAPAAVETLDSVDGSESFEFQAEVNRLMDIIINSLYKNKEIFLREVISNASDALDKIRFLAVADPSALEGMEDLKIEISASKEGKTLTIRDTGVGMTKADLIANLGTVAKSGTTNFAEALSGAEGDMNLIGQFGVGFYSIYLVADRVRVRSKHNDDEQHIWESTADSNFYVAADPEGNTLGRGTEITLFLKEDALEYTGEARLEALIKRYSEFITFPIYLRKAKTVEMDEDDYDMGDEEDLDDEDDDEEDAYDEDDDDEDDNAESITSYEFERVNAEQAIWARDKDEIEDEEYQNFYKSLSKDFSDALDWIHFKAEGEVEFRSIMFIPASRPSGHYDNYHDQNAQLRLYVRKVLISDDFEELLPQYLNFVSGVVDSDDLPLNVSRETLQQHKILKVMGKKLVRKVLEMLRKMAQKSDAAKEDENDEDDEDDDDEETDDEDDEGDASMSEDLEEATTYEKFWEAFGKNIKLGIVEDTSNRSKLSKLLRYKTSKSDGEWVSLDEYVSNMKDWQEEIYFITGESVEAVEKAPMLEKLRQKDLEVLYLVDPLDEYVVQHLMDYDGKKMMSVSKEGLTFGDEDEALVKRREKAYKEMFKPLTDFLKTTLRGKVSKVAVSNRIADSPCVIVTSQFGNSANMERIMKAQAFGDASRMGYMKAQKTLEINPRHPLIAELNTMAKEQPEEQATIDSAHLIYETALVASGFAQEDVEEHAQRMYRTIAKSAGVESMELLDEIEVPEEEEEAAEEDVEDLDDDEYDDEDGSDEL